ncbi:hypothetical protein SSTU70S_02069 [Stutzerimonas stutzeri]
MGVLRQTQAHTLETQRRQTQLTRPQAARDIRHHHQPLQVHRRRALAQQHIVRQQLWRQPLPAPFEAPQLDRHRQQLGGLVLRLQTILGDQRHQLPAQAGHTAPRRPAPTPQSTATGAAARRGNGRGDSSGSAPRLRPGVHSAQSSTTSYCSCEYMLSTWNLIERPMKLSRSATLPDSSSSSRSMTFWLASTR